MSNQTNFLTSKMVVVLGPTAVGKSALAVRLAKKFNGEIISADSRQVYRGLNLGTGKITKREMGGVPHHLLDVTSPNQIFTVSDYERLARQAVIEITARGRLPIISGGTGFYLQALTNPINLPAVKPNLKLRRELEKLPTQKLFEQLKKF
ncbi:MAG: tRNA (adenosine(37)-N6)-dimethylallyltransferase MiaA, partial [Patescibacteria group bacterium]